jgi:hypothetical protein
MVYFERISSCSALHSCRVVEAAGVAHQSRKAAQAVANVVQALHQLVVELEGDDGLMYLLRHLPGVVLDFRLDHAVADGVGQRAQRDVDGSSAYPPWR